MARSAAPQSHQFNRSTSSSSGGSRSSSARHHSSSTTASSNNNDDVNRHDNKKLTSTSILPTLLSVPFSIVHFIFYRILKVPFDSYCKLWMKQVKDVPSESADVEATIQNVLQKDNEREKQQQQQQQSNTNIFTYDVEDEYLNVKASPGLTTLLDDALYRAYEAELVPTVTAASQLLTEFIEMKETSALILRECRYMVGVPLSGGMSIYNYNDCSSDEQQKQNNKDESNKLLAIGSSVYNGIFLGEGAFVNKNGMPHVKGTEIGTEAMYLEEISNWNEFDTIQDFALQCYMASNEAIQKLTTDRLAESANLTLQDSMIASLSMEEGNVNGGSSQGAASSLTGGSSGKTPPQSPTHHTTTTSSSSPGGVGVSGSSSLPSPLTASSSPTDAGIGRCYVPQPRRDTWESPRLYCPDYYWADESIGLCHRLLKSLSKHRFVTLISTHGWDKYTTATTTDMELIQKKKKKMEEDMLGTYMIPPTYASCTPHVFPSLEAVHALQYLMCELLPNTIPSKLNQFRAAVESNAVVSKRLYLVKCEYRAPMRALWESYMNLNSAPKIELVERYLRDYHGVITKIGSLDGSGRSVSAGGGSNNSEGGSSSKSSGFRRKGSTEVAKKSALQQQREKLEKLITSKYWKHPSFVEALQLERCCERMEIEMSQMLLPLANLAAEIMDEWKGRLRAVALVDGEWDEGEVPDDALEPLSITFGWEDVPYMRELLRRLKSILRRKPDVDESTGIRPLLLDLQGVPRHRQDPIDALVNMPFYPQSSVEDLPARIGAKKVDDHSDEYLYLELFFMEVEKLLKLLSIPNMPLLVEERLSGSNKGDKNTLLDLVEQCNEVWDEAMFRAQFKDWFDMIKRQQEINTTVWQNGVTTPDMESQEETRITSLSELAEIIREAEIELSIAMASKDQLERVHKRLEALRADKTARYKVLAHIVFDIGYRELNDGIVVEPPADDAKVEFPKLSVPGVFGDQLIESGEVLPVG